MDMHDQTDQTVPGADQLNAHLGVLTRREVEARILQPLIEALCAEFGETRVLELVRGTIVRIARDQGRALREQQAGNDLVAFAGTLEHWTRGNALEIETLACSETEFNFNVTRCRYAEMYRALGMEDLGHILSCQRDFALIEGFNGEVTLERTQTIMEGASHCDFRYRHRAPVTLQ